MDLGRLWEATLEAMRTRIGHTDVEIWLDRTSAVSIDEHAGVLTVQVDNRYYSEWIQENYDEELRDSLRAAAGRVPAPRSASGNRGRRRIERLAWQPGSRCRAGPRSTTPSSDRAGADPPAPKGGPRAPRGPA